MKLLSLVAKAARKPDGIRTHGDHCKSIRFRASMVVIGSLFAGHIESGRGESFKEYGLLPGTKKANDLCRGSFTRFLTKWTKIRSHGRPKIEFETLCDR